MPTDPRAKWWWCKECQVKWCDVDATCWSCGSTLEERSGGSLAANCPPALTSQSGF